MAVPPITTSSYECVAYPSESKNTDDSTETYDCETAVITVVLLRFSEEEEKGVCFPNDVFLRLNYSVHMFSALVTFLIKDVL